MAAEYLTKLIALLKDLNIERRVDHWIEVKHFFSGAALYVDDFICASLSPVGLAFKLTDSEVTRLIEKGAAIPLKYFPKGHIKKGYALFENPDLTELEKWREYFMRSIQQALGE